MSKKKPPTSADLIAHYTKMKKLEEAVNDFYRYVYPEDDRPDGRVRAGWRRTIARMRREYPAMFAAWDAAGRPTGATS